MRTVNRGAGLDREAVLYRWDPSDGEIDSLGVLFQYAPGQEGQGLVPMPVGDAWSVFEDGTVARVVAGDYQVEWWLPDGRTVNGPPIPHRRVGVGRPEREAWVEELLAGPPAGMAMQRGGIDARPSPADVAERVRELDPGRLSVNGRARVVGFWGGLGLACATRPVRP